MPGRRAVIYARISRDRVGAGLGVDRQRDDCRGLADQLGWTVVAEHTDNDLSAYSGKPRPGYLALLEDLEAGRADAVLAWHTDRLHRSPAELERFIATCEPRSVPTHCVKAGPLDLSSPSGRLVARQLGAVARYETEHQIERAKRAKAQAAADGRFRGGRRSFGYETDGVTIRESEAVQVRDMAARVLAGDSVRSIARALNEQGSRGTRGARWTGASVRDVVVKVRNAGLVEHDGEVVGPARWPAILPESEWRAVRSVLLDPSRVRVHSQARKWLGSGLYRCGRCGEPVRIGSGGHSRPTARPYYRCSGPRVHVTRVAEHVDDLVGKLVCARLARPDAAELGAAPVDAGEQVDLHGEANSARARLDELSGLYAAGEINARQLAHGSQRLRETLADLEGRIGAVRRGSVFEGLAGRPDAGVRWSGLSLDRKRAVLDALLTVTILPGHAGRKPGGQYFDPESVRVEWKPSGQ